MKMTSSIILVVLAFLGNTPLSKSAMKIEGQVSSCAGSRHLKVLSYNIHHGLGIDDSLSLERIARVIKSASPDIVALQEVDINTKRNGNVNQMEVLAKLTGMNFVFGKSIDWDGGAYGNGVLTKLKVKSHKTYPLPGGEPRSALAVALEVKGFENNEFVFISTHLDTEENWRNASISHLKELLDEHKNEALILAGDFNAEEASPVLNFFNRHMTNATKNIATIPVDNPTVQIDYIMFTPNVRWKVSWAGVVDEKIASDHRPLATTIELLDM